MMTLRSQAISLHLRSQLYFSIFWQRPCMQLYTPWTQHSCTSPSSGSARACSCTHPGHNTAVLLHLLAAPVLAAVQTLYTTQLYFSIFWQRPCLQLYTPWTQHSCTSPSSGSAPACSCAHPVQNTAVLLRLLAAPVLAAVHTLDTTQLYSVQTLLN
jgi:hypothetical protein